MTILVSANTKRLGKGGVGTLGSLVPVSSFYYDDVVNPDSFYRAEIIQFPLHGELFAFNNGTFSYSGSGITDSFTYRLYENGSVVNDYVVTLSDGSATVEQIVNSSLYANSVSTLSISSAVESVQIIESNVSDSAISFIALANEIDNEQLASSNFALSSVSLSVLSNTAVNFTTNEQEVVSSLNLNSFSESNLNNSVVNEQITNSEFNNIAQTTAEIGSDAINVQKYESTLQLNSVSSLALSNSVTSAQENLSFLRNYSYSTQVMQNENTNEQIVSSHIFNLGTTEVTLSSVAINVSEVQIVESSFLANSTSSTFVESDAINEQLLSTNLNSLANSYSVISNRTTNLNGNEPTSLFVEPSIIEQISLAFDTQGKPVVFYKINNYQLKVYYFDYTSNSYVLENIAQGTDPNTGYNYINHGTGEFSEVVITYKKNSLRYMRTHSTNFKIEYLLNI